MQERAEQTRRTLIDVAAKLFDARGLAGTGLMDVGRGAELSKGALYFHFAGKGDLASAVVSEARGHAHALADRYLTGDDPSPRAACRFIAALARELRHDVVLRAGMRLEAEGSVGGKEGKRGKGEVYAGQDDGTPTLREEWLGLMRRHCADAKDGPALAGVLGSVMVGLETLGREDHTWWADETVEGIVDLLTKLDPGGPPAR